MFVSCVLGTWHTVLFSVFVFLSSNKTCGKSLAVPSKRKGKLNAILILGLHWDHPELLVYRLCDGQKETAVGPWD